MMQSQVAPCSACGRPLNPAQASLSTATGLPICPMCVAGEGLQATQGRAAQSMAFGAFGTACSAWALFFLLCGWMGVAIGIAAIATGAQALSLLGKPDYQHVPNRGLLYTAAISGIVGGALLPLAYGVQILISAATHFIR
jgi:hypothetical protein